MDIQIHGDLDIAVSQDLTETFVIESHIDASGGKGMSEHMKMKILDLALLKDLRETVLHSPWFRKGFLFSTDHITGIRLPVLLQEGKQYRRQWNAPEGGQ